MRIAFDYQTFVLQSYGGISRYFAQLAHGLIGLQQQVHIFAPLHRNRYLCKLPTDSVTGKEINSYPARSTKVFSVFNQAISRNKVAGWCPDIMHETFYSRFTTAPKNCPIVITIHDMIHELFTDEFPVWDRTVSLKKISLNRADHIICVSENTRRDLLNLTNISVDKVSVVNHGFELFKKDLTDVSIKPDTIPFILYVGKRTGYKNFSKFIKAVSISRNIRRDFKVIAFGGGKFSKSELEMLTSLGFSDNQVQQIDGDDELLSAYYRSARAFIYPSIYEGFGIPPLESMANQCPVISSNSSSMPEVIGDAAEYFFPKDLDDIRRAIEAVVYSDDRIKELRFKGAERLNAFSWNRCVSETLEIYAKVISS